MAKKLGRRERVLFKKLQRVPLAKRRACRKLADDAAKELGCSTREFFAELNKGGELNEAAFALQLAASSSDGWQKHFKPKERDWSGFFSALMQCFSEFAPIILAI